MSAAGTRPPAARRDSGPVRGHGVLPSGNAHVPREGPKTKEKGLTADCHKPSDPEWSRESDSNRRPADYESAALPTELSRPERDFCIPVLARRCKGRAAPNGHGPVDPLRGHVVPRHFRVRGAGPAGCGAYSGPYVQPPVTIRGATLCWGLWLCPRGRSRVCSLRHNPGPSSTPPCSGWRRVPGV